MIGLSLGAVKLDLKSIFIRGLLGVTSLAFMTINASAETKVAKDPVSVDLKTYLISVGKDGNQTAKLVSNVKPNDVIEYRATYTNNTLGEIKNLSATLPIPTETQFLGKSKPENAKATTDGINFSPMPLKKKEGNQLVDIPLQDYRALRWTIAVLPAGKSITVSAQIQVRSEKAETK
ncbi:hypothetical protein P256_02371 [Acinetobacter nectaris CIP 110549]|uniref:DUF11 domain-containing protein n=2 Tax=Acinetobacter nectaris TaxID=1219382 RepID=V2THZ8_9GAMM|nr:hypothetical protein P256_02371 [Acinetobacter nectaris CIP 110549]